MNDNDSSRDELLDHEYDGILEYDNPMPRWWKATFWVTIVFSVFYWFHYHGGGWGQGVLEAYAADMQAHAQARAAATSAMPTVSEETLLALQGDTATATQGSALYATRCVACHGALGEGGIGPNLTDSAWLHGKGALLDIYNVVANGVLEKGMPSWSNQLSPADLRAVVAFVGTMRNTNVKGGKAPQGAVP